MNRVEFPGPPDVSSLLSARDMFLRGGGIDPRVPPSVLESWRRSKALGIDARYVHPQNPAPEQLDEARERARLLLQASQSSLRLLHGTFDDSPHVVALSDSTGTVVRLLTSKTDGVWRRVHNFFEGASWSESAIGSNGIGTALASGSPVLVAGPQHFVNAYAPWSCIGVPLRAPNGDLIGVLNLSLALATTNEQSWNLTLSVAEAIEADLGRIWLPRSDGLQRIETDPLETVRQLDTLIADLTLDARDGAVERLRDTVRGLVESRAQFEKWDLRKDRALGQLAHELRNPLNVVAMLSELVERAKGDPSRLDDIASRLRQQARRLKRRIGDIDDIVQLKRGAIDFREQTLNLNQLVERAVEAVLPDALARQQNVSVRLSTAPLDVKGDADRIDQILTNILVNATKYTQRGGNIVVESEAAGGDVVVRIRDDGSGISPENLRTIFDEFSRFAPAPDDPGGAGIGLALVKQLVRLHRGSITAKSDGLGKGSEFEVRLPAAPKARPDTHQ